MKKTEQRDLFPGALEMMILRTLKRQPMHGYALAQHIKRCSNDLLQIEEGSLYPALQRLLKEELVKAEWGISATNRRIRIYKLTKAGTSMEQVLVPLQWSSSARPLVAKVRSNTGGIYVVDCFVSVDTKTIQSPDPLQSTATYSTTIDSNNNWLITDVGGIGSALQSK